MTSTIARRSALAAFAAAACGTQPAAAPAPPVAPAAPAPPDGAVADRSVAAPGDVASWLTMKMRTFEGSVRASNGSSTRTRYRVSLADGFVLSSSSELDATYALKATDVADGVLVAINMNGAAPDLEAEAARAPQYRKHVTKKEPRAGGFLLETEDEVGTATIEVAIPAHGETMTCTADLYTTQPKDQLVPWAEAMCSSLRAE